MEYALQLNALSFPKWVAECSYLALLAITYLRCMSPGLARLIDPWVYRWLLIVIFTVVPYVSTLRNKLWDCTEFLSPHPRVVPASISPPNPSSAKVLPQRTYILYKSTCILTWYQFPTKGCYHRHHFRLPPNSASTQCFSNWPTWQQFPWPRQYVALQ